MVTTVVLRQVLTEMQAGANHGANRFANLATNCRARLAGNRRQTRLSPFHDWQLPYVQGER
jgi:hypothetical protein